MTDKPVVSVGGLENTGKELPPRLLYHGDQRTENNVIHVFNYQSIY